MPTISELETMAQVGEIITTEELVRDYHDPITLNTYRVTYNRRSTRCIISIQSQVTLGSLRAA